jgi:hypothetical protein
MTGAIKRLAKTGETVSLIFEPHGSRVVVFRKESGAAPPAASARQARASLELKSGWTLSIGSTKHEGTIDLPHSWTGDPRTRYLPAPRHTSGRWTFRRTFARLACACC